MTNSWLRRISGLADKRIHGEEKEGRWIKLGLVKFLSPGLTPRENGEAKDKARGAAKSLANYEAETYLTSHLHRINAGLRDSLFTGTTSLWTGTSAQQHRAFYDTPRHRALNHLWSPRRSRELLDYVYGKLVASCSVSREIKCRWSEMRRALFTPRVL